MPHQPGSHLPQAERPLQHDPVIERSEPHDPLQGSRIGRQRIEGRAEQEQRERDQRHQVEVGEAAHEGGRGHTNRRERKADQQRRGERQQRPGGSRQTGDRHGQQEQCGVAATTQQRPGDLPDGHVPDTERGREHRVVRPGDLELEVDVERRVIDRAVHRGAGEQRRRDVARVGHAPDIADEASDPDTDAAEIEERLDDPGQDDDRGPPVDQQVALHQAPGAAHRARGGHDDSLRRNALRTSRYPAPARTSRYAAWPSDAASPSRPAQAPRVSSTACHSGVA